MVDLDTRLPQPLLSGRTEGPQWLKTVGDATDFLSQEMIRHGEAPWHPVYAAFVEAMERDSDSALEQAAAELRAVLLAGAPAG